MLFCFFEKIYVFTDHSFVKVFCYQVLNTLGAFAYFRTIFMMKAFPANVSVTVITGNYYDEQLPSALNKVRT